MRYAAGCRWPATCARPSCQPEEIDRKRSARSARRIAERTSRPTSSPADGRARCLLARRLRPGAVTRVPELRWGGSHPIGAEALGFPRHRGRRLRTLRNLRRWPASSAAWSSSTETRRRARRRADACRSPRLGLEPAARDSLDRLGIRTLGEFLDLPAEGHRKRFGPEVLRLHRLATGELRVPLQPDRPEPAAINAASRWTTPRRTSSD